MEKVAKRKKVALTIEEKFEILDSIKTGTSYTVISERYGVGRSTVADIKRNASKLEKIKQKTVEMGFKKATFKVKILFERPYPDSTQTFTVCTGFQLRFSKWHGLKNLLIQGEQASADFVTACDFKQHFS